MANKKGPIHSPLFPSSHYYARKDYQISITAFRQTVTHETVLKNNYGITLMYFYGDSGSIIVNSVEYPVQRGAFICLGSYHYFKLKPSGQPMNIAQCRLSYDTFLYMAANPYYKLSEINLNRKPLFPLLDEETANSTEPIIEELITLSDKKRLKNKANVHQNMKDDKKVSGNFLHKSGSTEFYLSMRLMGILQKTYLRE